MAYLKVSGEDSLITRFVSFKNTQELILTVQTALDGTEYLTRFGSPTVRYELEVYVDETGKAALMSSADLLPLLEVSAKQGLFTGRITELGKFDYLAAGWYKSTVILSAVSEVTDR
ncbi:MAG: hypothetical protein PHV18_00040 [Lachnospiraceae bacterium]|nr:hypothetical protein [Lachnospiraceae bacterium]